MANWLQQLASSFGGGRKSDVTSKELQAFLDVYGSRLSSAGVTVNWDTALSVSTVLAICRVLQNGVSQVPFRLYREVDGNRVPAKDHPLYALLSRAPNPWQSSFEFRETSMLHLTMTNNAFAFKNRVGIARTVRELIPIEPQRVEVKQLPDFSLNYLVKGKNGEVQTFGQDAIWHLRGPSWNSWVGLDATKLARNAIGLGMAIENGQAEFHKNGAQMTGLLSVEDELSGEQFAFLAGWLDKHLPGGDRYQKPLVMDRKGEFTPFTMTGVDSQLLETRRHQVEEICRNFGVMPIMVGHSDKAATYASAEQMFLAHVTHTLMPWYSRIEQSADMNLLSEQERADGYYFKFSPNALMRGAAVDRATFYSKALGAGGSKGWMTQNDVRGYEELDRSDDPEADKLPQAVGRPAGTPPDNGGAA